MRPVGTFLDFTRLYVYVYSMFTFVFLVNKLPAKSTILPEILYTFGQMKKSIILDIVTLSVFTWSIFLEYNSKWTDCFVLCSNVVWNPFLMKTTFTSDFSWFESVSGSTSLLYQYSHQIMFPLYCNTVKSKPTVSFQARVTERNILNESAKPKKKKKEEKMKKKKNV